MRELAVLKWHKVGCYATAFAAVPVLPESSMNNDLDEKYGSFTEAPMAGSTVSTVQQRRDEKAQTTHWLAAGAKDGKVSLWDIY